jgi:WD40 repeat protein
MIRVWDVATGEEVAVLEFGEQPVTYSLRFVSDDLLFSLSESGLLQWNIKTGVRKLLYEGTSRESIARFAASIDGRRLVMVERDNVKDSWGRVVLLELDSGTVTHLDRFGDEVTGIALDATGTFAVTGDLDGEVRVGLLTGEEPHLITGHTGCVWALAIDPKGRWIASGGNDTTVRLWPMPDLSKPPLHTLPREALIAKLKTLTNLRVVRDPESATGWKLTHDPFPGWETVPTW